MTTKGDNRESGSIQKLYVIGAIERPTLESNGMKENPRLLIATAFNITTSY